MMMRYYAHSFRSSHSSTGPTLAEVLSWPSQLSYAPIRPFELVVVAFSSIVAPSFAFHLFAIPLDFGAPWLYVPWQPAALVLPGYIEFEVG